MTVRSISTMRGDAGETSLAGGVRVSKASNRVEAYGTIDELGSVLGFARSICAEAKIREATKTIQKELFTVSAAITGGQSGLTKEMVDSLTTQVNEIESMEGILGDWALPGENTVAAAYDVARTVCRRAERVIVRLLNEVPGFRCASPGGAFYAWPNVTEACERVGASDSEELRKRLLHEAGVAVLADIHFGPRVPGDGQHIRFSYAASDEAIEEGVRRIDAFIRRAQR